ncbi:hypothetical protein ABGB07_12670 [Micromonosporaceae bacterium B7E4]
MSTASRAPVSVAAAGRCANCSMTRRVTLGDSSALPAATIPTARRVLDGPAGVRR